MEEQRKYAILFAATLLAARKLMPPLEEEGKPNMAVKFLTDRYVKIAIEQAADILDKIDERWPR